MLIRFFRFCLLLIILLLSPTKLLSQDQVVVGKVDIGRLVLGLTPDGWVSLSKIMEKTNLDQEELQFLEDELQRQIKIYEDYVPNELPAVRERKEREIADYREKIDKTKENLGTQFDEEMAKFVKLINLHIQKKNKDSGFYFGIPYISEATLSDCYILDPEDYTLQLMEGLGIKYDMSTATKNVYDKLKTFTKKVGDLKRYHNYYLVVNSSELTWDVFYKLRKKNSLTFQNEDEIKNKITHEVESWQAKGEFESTAMWQERVNDKTRAEYIESRKKYYIDLYNSEIENLRTEQNKLLGEFQSVVDELYKRKHEKSIAAKSEELKKSDFILHPYDADHETFLINNSLYGDILLQVPLQEAAGFKNNWSSVKASLKPTFVPNGEDDILTQLEFFYNGKAYTYNNLTVATYALTEVNYNFNPIDFKDINISDFNIESKQMISKNSDQKIINKEKEITAKTVESKGRVINASHQSNIDFEIPRNNSRTNSLTFAVIIANENYDNVGDVPYALNDGQILNEYLVDCVGLPQDHVKIYKNASFGNIAAAMRHIDNLSKAFGSDLNLIFYYAGHGFPNESSKNPLILPVDADASIPETCYDLGKIINTLGKLDANSVVVLLDACFSGAERGDNMILASRGVRMKSKESTPLGKMVILSASQGDETAYPLNTERHGLFTYFLLKNLQENNGKVTLGELSDYIIKNVKQQSIVSNGKLQTPSISVSPLLESTWHQMGFGQY